MTREGIVIGIGNTLRGDDGVGVEVAMRLGPTPSSRRDVMVTTTTGEPTALIEAWSHRPFAIVIDAIAGGSAAPGAIVVARLGSDALPWRGRMQGTHDVDLTEAIALAEALDRLPDALVVVGVHGEDFDLGDGMSPAVEAVIGEVAAVIEGLIDELQDNAVEGV